MSAPLSVASSITYQTTPSGVFARLDGERGSIEATIHCKFSSLEPFRVCFATCTGGGRDLQGKVRDYPSMDAIETELKTIRSELLDKQIH